MGITNSFGHYRRCHISHLLLRFLIPHHCLHPPAASSSSHRWGNVECKVNWPVFVYYASTGTNVRCNARPASVMALSQAPRVGPGVPGYFYCTYQNCPFDGAWQFSLAPGLREKWYTQTGNLTRQLLVS